MNTAPATAPATTPDIARLLTLFTHHVQQSGFRALATHSAAEFIGAPGPAVLFFAEDPRRVPESWDVAVVLPDIVGRQPEPLRVGLLDPVLARTLAPQYGVAMWPALVFLRDGQYLGALERMRDWDEYAELIPQILARAPGQPPAAGTGAVH